MTPLADADLARLRQVADWLAEKGAAERKSAQNRRETADIIEKSTPKELREAHMRKLEAESAVEYARSVVAYNEQRIARLHKRLAEHTTEGEYAPPKGTSNAQT